MNTWCETLDVDVPSLEAVKDHPEANTFALLLVALLERGAPMTLEEVAARFEAAGIADTTAARRSLARCRPARNPVYRDGDHYTLDPHSDELDLWAFRLGLRPPKVPRLRLVRPEPEPLPGPDVPLTPAELDEAFCDSYVWSWSAQRLALAILDAHGGRLPAQRVLEIMDGLTTHHPLGSTDPGYWRARAITITDDGWWELVPGHAALASARTAVRARVETARGQQAARPDPAVAAAQQRFREQQRKADIEAMAKLRRAIVRAFPPDDPRAVTILDVAARTLQTFMGEEVADVASRLASYDLIGAVDVRPMLRAIGFDPGDRRLADLDTPQKTMRINRRGDTLRITLDLLVQGCCGISRPFAATDTLASYLDTGQATKLRRRLEADTKSLFALYQYGRLHGAVRLRWGFIDEMIRAPWFGRGEVQLGQLKHQAFEREVPLQVVAGTAPGWADPWARAIECNVIEDPTGWRRLLVDRSGWVIDERDVQAARLLEG